MLHGLQVRIVGHNSGMRREQEDGALLVGVFWGVMLSIPIWVLVWCLI